MKRHAQIAHVIAGGIVFLLIMLLTARNSHAQIVNSFWIGGAGSFKWDDPLRWNPGIIPDNTATTKFNVFIDGGAAGDATVSIWSTTAAAHYTINNLSISTGDTLVITHGPNGTSTLMLEHPNAAVFNEGTLRMITGSGTHFAELQIDDTLRLEGGGVVSLEGDRAHIKRTLARDETLTNVDNTIQGFGRVGDGLDLRLVNQTNGLVDANVSGKTLEWNADDRGGSNSGIMQASNGGKLLIGSADYDITGGVIRALDGSLVELGSAANDAFFTGGKFSTSGSGEIQVAATRIAAFDDLTIDGKVRLNAGAELRLNGQIANKGEIIVSDSAGTNIRIDAGATATLSGAGAILLSGAQSEINSNGTGILIQGNHTIQGAGRLGVDDIIFTNQGSGLVDANINGGTLRISPFATGTGVINRGVLRATGNGTLLLSDGVYDNANGVIRAGDGSLVVLGDNAAPPVISGGELQSNGSGEIQVAAARVATLQDLTLDGTLRVNSGAELRLAGQIDNGGQILVHDAAGTNIRISANETASLIGGGTVTLAGGLSEINSNGTGTLINHSNVIEGAGDIGVNDLKFTNMANGMVHANLDGSTLNIDPANGGAGVATAINDGTWRVSNNATMMLRGNGGGEFAGSGHYQALNGGDMVFNSSADLHHFDGLGHLNSGQWLVSDNGAGTSIVVSSAASNVQSIGPNASVVLAGPNPIFTVNGVAVGQSLQSVEGMLGVREGHHMITGGDLTNQGGRVEIDGSGSILDVSGIYTQTSGRTILTNAGELRTSGGIQISGGRFGGNGIVLGGALFDGLSVVAPGNSTGILFFNAANGFASDLEIELRGTLVDGAAPNFSIVNTGYDPLSTELDQIHGWDSIVLADGLQIQLSFLDGFRPGIGDFFDVVTADSLQIGNISWLAPGFFEFDVTALSLFDPTTGANRDVLRFTTTAIPEPTLTSLLAAGVIGL